MIVIRVWLRRRRFIVGLLTVAMRILVCVLMILRICLSLIVVI